MEQSKRTLRTYTYNNLHYTIIETDDIHELLQAKHSNSVEIAIPDEKENSRPGSNYAWTVTTTKLLIAEYEKRLAAFRNPTHKRNKLWREIA
ncbi:hypothetical protein QE152_g36536 [Popillia japonica]|uniref:Uncharacterized protein n=1 Tax=Popillia japonica TaxID=7064 RepID=A0AAW1IDH3_POPJA